MQEYQLTLNDKRIVWGKVIDIEPLIGKFPGDSIRQGVNAALDWNLPAGIYRAKEIVMELDKMLEAMLVQLGEPVNSDPAVLLDSLQANLAISGRVSSLPLGPLALEDKAGAEITAQAVRIGEQLVSWAREINAGKKTLAKYGPETLGKLEFRSHCYGHALIPEAIAQVWGPFGGPRVMQIYNEYLHQFVLLRDALLPFANWEEVPFEVKEYAEFKGLRFLEPAREIFLTQLLGKKLTHKSMVQYAQSVVSSGLTKAGYGFQYRLGTVLPAGLGEQAGTAARYLLKWHPVQTIAADGADETQELAAVSFDYEYEDYYAAPRNEAGKGTPVNKEEGLAYSGEHYDEPAIARLLPNRRDDRTTLRFSLKMEGREFAVDLGQLFRGQRFLYRPHGSDNPDTAAAKRNSLSRHLAADILSHSGLVTNTDGIHFIPTGGNELVLWALLGKLYPENVVLLDRGDREELEAAYVSGKGFGTQFLVL
ncbi:hypothetical protein NYE69_18280 [Paenibacillus sp. FSL R5-0527]|uniref:hypothetical protein n=1 Tax=Paenibacillus TaxID=44249 RepID=UPI00097A6860|nr:hypothetical protein [Paenibacillus macerans]MEC0329079.1 hypothetical protein [Paenibacillus macerans]MED4957982.1 hypothetical protein [Paenibacillus macerans]OMG51528.1 hypothetical protein BK140_02465 [Paenibacillus macerans]